MYLKPIAFIVGLLVALCGGLMLIPASCDLFLNNAGALLFFRDGCATALAGSACALLARSGPFRLDPRQILVLANLAWMTLAALAALPFCSVGHLSFSDAFFETMSGITTTGSTVMSDLQHADKGLLLWRSMLQWIGGIGFIVIAVAILPLLRVGGMRLFQSESSDWSDKCLPRSGSIAKATVLVYLCLSLLCTLGYYFGGMSIFDAINHAMTTLSTGGYSTDDASMGSFSNAWIYWNGTTFMLLGSLPFILFVRAGSRPGLLFFDSQVLAFLGFMALLWIGMTLWLTFTQNQDFFFTLTRVAFNTTSVVTTTGYALGDYSRWGNMPAMVFFFLMLVGGCSGSTAGGIKIFRFQIAIQLLSRQLKQACHPRAFIVHRYNGEEVTADILRSLIAFCFFYSLLVALIAVLLSGMGVDMVTSLTAALTAVSNIGPGLGDVVGPAGNFASLPDMAKWLLSLGMLMGRLEIITVLVLFTPAFWKD